jgi:hypothetical protein
MKGCTSINRSCEFFVSRGHEMMLAKVMTCPVKGTPTFQVSFGVLGKLFFLNVPESLKFKTQTWDVYIYIYKYAYLYIYPTTELVANT